MATQYQENGRIFVLRTDHSTYQMKAGSYRNLLHLYYRDRIGGPMEYMPTFENRGFLPNPCEAGDDRTYSLGAPPQEYPHQGSRNFRDPAFIVEQADRPYELNLRYAGYGICRGKYSLPGPPAIYRGRRKDAGNLKIRLTNQVSGLAVILLYGVFLGYDVITRAVCAESRGDGPTALKRVYDARLDFLHGEYDLIRFYRRHAMECDFRRTAPCHGAQVIGSRRETSGHRCNPFLILVGRETTEASGPYYGMSFVYNGPSKAEAGTGQYDRARMIMGLQDGAFSYELGPEEHFFGLEVVIGYDGQGLGILSHSIRRTMYHSLYRGKCKTIPRPMLINNWETTYFDFTGEKILDIARQMKDLGVEMMMLDDGWFGSRDSDFSRLGDQQVSVRKLGGSLGNLVSRIDDLGMKFGIWMESGMVSKGSCLYREHPDWTFTVPGKEPVRGRSQLALDFSRKGVVGCISDSVRQVLGSTHIKYLKQDMNRSIVDIYSTADKTTRGDSPGSVLYRYMLGLYDFLERLTKRYPDLPIEGYSGGGEHFDAGILYYTPQIWCSDNTGAVDRIRIQYSTSLGYPISAVDSHISAVPNHQIGRITLMKTKGMVTMADSFGCELDLNAISDEEKSYVREQINAYHKYQHLIHDEGYYRLISPFGDRETAA